MSDQEPAPSPLSGLLGRDYWLIMSAPVPGTGQAAIDARVEEHVRWLLDLEANGDGDPTSRLLTLMFSVEMSRLRSS